MLTINFKVLAKTFEILTKVLANITKTLEILTKVLANILTVNVNI